MCRSCEIESKGIRSGKGVALFSKYLLASRACEHSPKCECDLCEKYRDRNKWSDTGTYFRNRPELE